MARAVKVSPEGDRPLWVFVHFDRVLVKSGGVFESKLFVVFASGYLWDYLSLYRVLHTTLGVLCLPMCTAALPHASLQRGLDGRVGSNMCKKTLKP